MRHQFMLVLVLICFYGCGQMGNSPDEEQMQRFHTSENFDQVNQRFKNRRMHIELEMRANIKPMQLLKEYFFSKVETVPAMRLPEEKPDLELLLSDSSDVKLIWFGHSSFLLRLAEVTILVDPVFSNSASPVSFLVRRFQPAVLKVEALPKIDLVLLSHDHYDHLDKESIQKLQKKDRPLFISPLGVGAHLRGWGIEASQIIERDWWQSVTSKGIEFTATPAQHFSGRSYNDRNATLWASWVIQASGHKVYFSGDSGYDEHFKEIGERFGPFDLAFMECGQYNEQWQAVHMLPHQVADAVQDLQANLVFPVHWGMFELSLHHWAEPAVKLASLAKERNLSILTPKLGELVTVNDQYINHHWWESLLDPGLEL